jgi:hypothetical protein
VILRFEFRASHLLASILPLELLHQSYFMLNLFEIVISPKALRRVLFLHPVKN